MKLINETKNFYSALIASLFFTSVAVAVNSNPSSEKVVKESTYTSKCSCCDAIVIAEPDHESAYKYGRCTGTTKAGTRCKRGVSNAGDTRCYQHK